MFLELEADHAALSGKDISKHVWLNFRVHTYETYACQVKLQCGHLVGFLSTSNANKPTGKKHIATIIW